MSEAAPKDHRENAEIDGLIADLELQIEGLTAGLNKLRGTVARLSYASLAARVAIAPPPPNSLNAPAEPVERPAITLAAAPSPLPTWLPTPAYQQDPEVPEVLPEPGFWASVAEGASWPRSRTDEASSALPEASDAIAPEPAGASPNAGKAALPEIGDWTASSLRAEGLVEALKATAAEAERQVAEPPEATETETLTWPPAVRDQEPLSATQEQAAEAAETSAEVEEEAPAAVWATDRQPAEPQPVAAKPPVETREAQPPDDSTDTDAIPQPASIWERWQAGAPAAATPPPGHRRSDALPAVHDTAPDADPPAEEPADASSPPAASPMPTSLSFGWPDESIWSQNFEWSAMNGKAPPSPRVVETDPARAGVSDIVAQVRAELESARLADETATGVDETLPEAEAAGVSGSDGWSSDMAVEARLIGAGDDQAPLAESDASPALIEDSGNVEVADVAFEAGQPLSEESAAAEAADDAGQTMSSEQDDANRRDEVSRAVEDIRRRIEVGGLQAVMREQDMDDGTPGGSPETSPGPFSTANDGQGDKPAFRLAAPGSLPDWSRVPLEQAGPPVVVIKDADGRVELASVYETLNELGCGDGAALLNYTPHSVTVGLPASAPFPTADQISEAVEAVFGLTARVESDGVRITVSIGVDPKRRSVGAA